MSRRFGDGPARRRAQEGRTPVFFLARVETGRFGAHMEVALVNDGPVTFLLRS